MKTINKTLILSAGLMTLSLNALAHDPSLHTKKAEKADCTNYNKMVESGKKMDMNDPVMIAMMKKCKNQDGNHDQHEEKKADMKCGDMKDLSAKTGEKNHGDMKKMDHKKMKTEKQDDNNNSDK